MKLSSLLAKLTKEEQAKVKQIVAESQDFESLTGAWLLISAPKHVNKSVGKKAKFSGDEVSLKFGDLLLGEEDGNIYMELSGKYLEIKTPEGLYYFKKA